MSSVRLYFLRLKPDNSPAAALSTDSWMSELSFSKQTSIQRLINEHDRMASLIAMRLLKLCAQHENICNFHLRDIQYPESGKPYWPGNNKQRLDFNISHSDNLILVAVSKTLKVGIDAEKIRPLKRLGFKMVMLPEELERIKQTPNLFFDLWSKKEAVVKAANTAGIARMRDVELLDEHATLDESSWCIKSVAHLMKLENKFSVQLASSEAIDELIIKNISLQELME